jgi:hypothetical protein
LKSHGMKFGLDMAKVQWDNEKVYAVDEKHKLLKFEKISLIKSYNTEWGSIQRDCALLWVEPCNGFRGYHLKTIKK